jgi:hypothetical protein
MARFAAVRLVTRALGAIRCMRQIVDTVQN